MRKSIFSAVQSMVEVLEQRTLLSTVVVSSSADAGAGSLRDAIANATGGDTIVFSNTLKNKTIKLTTGELSITKSLDIEGLGAKKLAISGNHAGRVFHISGGGNVTLAGLTITDGLATVGGGILVEGSAAVTMSNCALSDNEALGDAHGGGAGGAIEDASLGTLDLDHCALEHNRAIVVGQNLPDFGLTFAIGGALDVGGPLLAQTGLVTVSRSTFSDNQALGASPGASAAGGAISLEPNTSVLTDNPQTGATLTLSDSDLNDNAAIGAAGGDNNSTYGSAQGGAINSFATTNLTVRCSTLSDNLAQGAPLATGAVPSQNSAIGTAAEGGGILTGGTLTVTDSTIRNNRVAGGAGAAGSAGSSGDGGGICAAFGATGSVSGCLVVGNTALGGAGGAGAVGGAGVSGGIDVEFDSTLTVSRTCISGNQAIGGAGGTGAIGGDGIGGAINVATGAVFAQPDGSTLTLDGCTLDHNQAIGGKGGSASNGGNGLGGGLAILDGSASVSNSDIEHNRANAGEGGRHGGSDGQGIGGGVYNLGVFNSDSSTIIRHNHASTSHDDLFA